MSDQLRHSGRRAEPPGEGAPGAARGSSLFDQPSQICVDTALGAARSLKPAWSPPGHLDDFKKAARSALRLYFELAEGLARR